MPQQQVLHFLTLFTHHIYRTSKRGQLTLHSHQLLGQWQFKYVTSQVSQLSFYIYNFQLGILYYTSSSFLFQVGNKIWDYLYPVPFTNICRHFGCKSLSMTFVRKLFICLLFPLFIHISLKIRSLIPLHHFPSPCLFS